VEIGRRIYDAMARRDATAVLDLYDAEVEWDASRTTGSVMGGGIFHGHEGLRSFFREWYEAWENVENRSYELIDAGDRVVAFLIARARARVSGAEVEWEMTAVWTIRDGKVHRVVWFPTRAEALEAVGLSE
jgi:ketosteroid isomerase-like protein